MRPYKNIKLTERPDVADIQSEGRKSSVGKLVEKCGKTKPYVRNAAKRKAIRRVLKRSDKAKMEIDD